MLHVPLLRPRVSPSTGRPPDGSSSRHMQCGAVCTVPLLDVGILPLSPAPCPMPPLGQGKALRGSPLLQSQQWACDPGRRDPFHKILFSSTRRNRVSPLSVWLKAVRAAPALFQAHRLQESTRAPESPLKPASPLVFPSMSVNNFSVLLQLPEVEEVVDV